MGWRSTCKKKKKKFENWWSYERSNYIRLTISATIDNSWKVHDLEHMPKQKLFGGGVFKAMMSIEPIFDGFRDSRYQSDLIILRFSNVFVERCSWCARVNASYYCYFGILSIPALLIPLELPIFGFCVCRYCSICSISRLHNKYRETEYFGAGCFRHTEHYQNKY